MSDKNSRRAPEGIGRRDLLRVGSLACLGLDLAALFRPEASGAEHPKRASHPSLRSCILIFCNGGPSHIDTFDMKPDAPAEIRGEFRSISPKRFNGGNMNVLVTGGSGTIGSYVLRELLDAGHEVKCYCRATAPLVQGAEFIKGDIMDLDRLTQACQGCDAIVHLAAVPGPRRATPEQLMSINVIGTVHVLEAAIRLGSRKVVFASSGAAAGFTFPTKRMTPRYFPVDEEHPAEPQDEYGLSKLIGEVTCKRYSDAYGMQTICLRINNNWYLDREGAELAVKSGWAKGLTVEKLWTTRYLRTIEDSEEDWPVPGPPSPRNNLWAVTDARDAAQAFRLALENNRLQHEVFFISGDDTCSTVETRTLVARHYPEVPLKAPLEGYASLVSHEKATRGYWDIGRATHGGGATFKHG